jgi:hypothetical protein
MKVWTMTLRLVALTAVVCYLMGVGSGSAQAQTPFTYPPFPSSTGGLQINGDATLQPNGTTNLLQLTPNSTDQVASAWYTNPLGTSEGEGAVAPFLSLAGGFTTTFQIRFTNPGGIGPADGIVFVVQNGSFGGYKGDMSSGATALGPFDGAGGELGYTGLTNSVGVQFDTYYNPEYGDIPASPAYTVNGVVPYSSTDEISVQSCGAAANTSAHTGSPDSGGTACTFGVVDLSTLATPIYLADENPHTVTITYLAPTPPASGTCTPGSTPNSGACGSLTIVVDTQTVLPNVPFSLSYLGLDPFDDAYVGFTAATGGGDQVQDALTWNFGTGTTVATTMQGAPLTQGATDTEDFDTTTGSQNIVTATTPSNNLGNSGATPFFTVVPTPPATPSALWANSPLATAVCTAIVAANGNCAPIDEVCIPPGGGAPTGPACPYDTTGVEDVLLSDTFDPTTPITNTNLVGNPAVVALNDSLSCPFAAVGNLTPPACPSNGLKSFTGPNQLKNVHGTSNSYYYYVTGVLAPAATPSGIVTVNGTKWVNGNTNAPTPLTLTAMPPATPSSNPTGFYPSPIDYIAWIFNPAAPPDPTLPLPSGSTTDYSSNSETSSGVVSLGVSSDGSTCAGVTTASTGAVLPAAPNYSFSVNLEPLTGGSYTLYYETEDCNRTAQRAYTYSGTPPQWSTSYASVAFNVDDTPPVITITTPSAGAIYPAGAAIASSFNCVDAGFDGGSGITPYGNCTGPSTVNTTSGGGVLTAKTFTVTSADNVGNASSQTVNYSVSCLYAKNSISPSSLTPGKLFIFTLTAAVTNCTASSQALTVNIVLKGPLGQGCSETSVTLVPSILVPSFTVTVPAGKSASKTVGPFMVPTNKCTNYPYVLTTTSSYNGTVVFTYSSTITD